ncbi:MAG: DUF1552 domain-containing protein [Myxococcota bacterium]
MPTHSPSRRRWLRMAGLAAVAAPFAPLLGKPARAAIGPAKYLLVFHTPGTDVDAWSPRGSSDSEIVFSEMTAPLEPLREDLLLFEKFDSLGTAGQHGAVGGLTGSQDWNRLYSLDQFVADALAAGGVSTSIPSVILGSVPGEDQRSFWRPGGNPLSPILSPRAAFEAIFTGATGPRDDGAVDALRARRERSIALLQGEFESIASRLGEAERTKLGLHADSLNSVLRRIQGSSGAPVGECASDAPTDTDSDIENSSLHLDLAISAFACDTTRVAAVQFGHHQNTQVALPTIGSPGNWHNDFMHSDPAPRARLIATERWLCEQFVAAANRLKALPSPTGSGTLWDETLMIWTRDMGDGISHAGDDMRFVISGGAGGYLQKSARGRYIDGRGAPHLQVLLTAAEAMGVEDFSAFGDTSLPASDRVAVAGARA